MTTKTTLGQHQFLGPYTHTDRLLQRSGVYIVTTINEHGQHMVLDVGESGNVKVRVTNHDRVESWKRHAMNGLHVSAHYCDEFTRKIVEQAVRAAYNPICGKQ